MQKQKEGSRMAKADSNGMTNAAGIAYGELIRRQRRSKKMSQEELGALVRVGKNAVGAWEAGSSRPDVGSVPVICRALDLSLDEFFGLQETARIDPGNQLETNEASELIRRYAALNPYNRQVVMREMDMLYDMQGSMKKTPRRVIRLYQNDMAASAGPGETLEAARGEEVSLYADSIGDRRRDHPGQRQQYGADLLRRGPGICPACRIAAGRGDRNLCYRGYRLYQGVPQGRPLQPQPGLSTDHLFRRHGGALHRTRHREGQPGRLGRR